MDIIKSNIDGLLVIQTDIFNDERGSFQKIFTDKSYIANNLAVNYKEFYYSVSDKGVIRGMHFQTPPEDHEKIVYVSSGKILDVVLDLRKLSKTFGHFFSIKLDANNGEFLYLPKGMAHGFLSLEDRTIVNYAQTTAYSKENDYGVLFSSVGFDWGISSPILSKRDLAFPVLEDFLTRNPF